MRVLKNNYNNEIRTVNKVEEVVFPRKLVCEECESELMYERDDIEIGEYGCAFVKCPCCGHNIYLDDGKFDIEITRDNVEYPTHFTHTSKENGAVDTCDNEHVREYIRKAIKYFRENKNEYSYGGHITGNLYISVYRYSGDEVYDVYVSNDFHHTVILFEAEDY